MTIAAVILLTLGMVLGALAVCYMPNDLIEETQKSFVISQGGNDSFPKLLRTNFIIEFLWIFAIWLLTTRNLTKVFAPFVAILRGAVVGFCVEFAFGAENSKEIILTGILPQCIVGLPVMTVFFAMCVNYAKEKRESRSESKYFILGGCFTLVTLVTALVESLTVMLFINIS